MGCPITGSTALPNAGGGTAPGDPKPLANPDWKLCVAFTNGDPPPIPCALVVADGADGIDGPPDTGLPATDPPDKGLPAFASPPALLNGDDGIDGTDDEDGIEGEDGIEVTGICDTPVGVEATADLTVVSV